MNKSTHFNKKSKPLTPKKTFSNSANDYLSDVDWINNLFLNHVKRLINDEELKKLGLDFNVGKNSVYVTNRDQKLLKLCVFHTGTSRDWMTFRNAQDKEVCKVRYTLNTQLIKLSITQYFQNS